MTALRLQHTSVQVPADLIEAASAFYRDVIGMEPIPNLAGVRWFQFGDGDHVHLLDGDGAAASTGHLALQVDDLAATVDRARSAGFTPARAREIWGAERWFVRDPAGNLVELFAEPPAPVA